jgi:hypothetical protein
VGNEAAIGSKDRFALPMELGRERKRDSSESTRLEKLT